ncbi:MAG: pyridoxal-phosphate dependent enzyme, partial [Candidatus Muiribacteriaceae bacterium]
MEYIRNRIGNTVLYRSKALQKETGLENIYLKMEGMNPTGRLQDRLAYAMVKEAAQLGRRCICLASLGPLGSSIAYVSGLFEGLECVIVIPEKSIEKKNQWFRQEHVKVIEYGKTYSDAFRKSSEMARENGWYDANPGYDNISISTVVYSEMADEIVVKLGKNPDNIFVFLGDGALLLGLHHGFRALWLKGKIERIPKIFASCTTTNHKILEAFNEGRKKVDDAYSRAMKSPVINRKNINYKVVDDQGVLNS